MDFEIGLQQQFRLQFPACKLQGCLFHLLQAARRRAVEIWKKQAPKVSLFIADLRALATVPDPSLFEKAVTGFLSKYPEISEYFARTFLGTFPPSQWALSQLLRHEKDELCTPYTQSNSPLESYNHHLNKMIKAHPSLPQFLEKLRLEAQKGDFEVPNGDFLRTSPRPQPETISFEEISDIQADMARIEHLIDASPDFPPASTTTTTTTTTCPPLPPSALDATFASRTSTISQGTAPTPFPPSSVSPINVDSAGASPTLPPTPATVTESNLIPVRIQSGSTLVEEENPWLEKFSGYLKHPLPNRKRRIKAAKKIKEKKKKEGSGEKRTAKPKKGTDSADCCPICGLVEPPRGGNLNSGMIGCDICGAWLHIACLPSDFEVPSGPYSCPRCSSSDKA